MLKTVQGKYTFTILLIVCLFLSCLLAVNFSLLKQHSISGAAETASLIRENAGSQIELFFEDMELLAKSLAGCRSVINEDTEQMGDLFLSVIRERQASIRAIYLGTAGGRMHEWGMGKDFTDFRPSFPPGYDPRERPWYRAAVEKDGYILTPPYLFASSNATGITAAVPVKDNSGKTLGVLGIDILNESIINLVNAIEVQKDGKLILLTADKRVLVNQFDGRPGNAESLPVFRYKDLAADGISGTWAEIYGKRCLISYGKAGETDWLLLLAVPYDSIMAFSLKNLKVVLTIDILLTLLLGVTITLLSYRILTAPLEEIVRTMRKMECGDSGARIRIHGNDEFAVISRLFNSLSDIRDESAKKMEERVAARTGAVLRLQQENLKLSMVREREEIYGNLHDSLGARLTGINISNRVAISAMSAGDTGLAEQMLCRITKNTAEAISDLRKIIQPPENTAGLISKYSADDLLDYIRTTLVTRMELKGITTDLELPDRSALDGMPGFVFHNLEKLLQETTSNLIKHSGADRAGISFIRKGESIILKITDNGAGFTLKDELKNGFGLQNLYSRAERLGGVLKILTKPGRGTSVEFQLKTGDYI